ncbi:fimbrillin family protein [Prevotella sp. 10(H)]|uniref:fimbrillin family protein n=1 Tax=Prevotella sp. 10(H) TaxID=1158294 RepID=UPI0004A7571D|nr:fimbrillin family protein [Prevotella sp. 10(H)]
MKKIFVLSILAILFAACSSDDDDNLDNQLVPISLNSKLVVEPRETRQDTQIAAGQQVSFFVTKAGNAADIVYNNAILTADGSGNFTYSYGSENTLYYPLDNSKVDFYAIHPYSVNNSLSNTLGFEVKQNQSLITDFLNSDLLYTKSEEVEKSTRAIGLIFAHKLSKITFEVIQGPGGDLTQLNAIEILNVESQINMSLSDGVLSASTSSPTTINPYGVRAGTSGETTVTGISAIIVPQLFSSAVGKPLFRFTLGATNFLYTPSADINFETGKKYNYRITIRDNGLSVTSKIEDWLATDDTEGEGTPE